MSYDSPSPTWVTMLPTAQECRGTAVYACMRFFVVALTVSFTIGCAGSTSSRDPNSPDDENNQEITEPQSEEAEQPAEADQDGEEQKAQEGTRPAKKRRPKRRRHVEVAPEPPPPPVARKPPPPPVEPPPEETAPPAYSEPAEQGDTTLEAEARKRCHWKSVPPYRPEWANAISPPVSRKITSKPICPYGTPPAVLRVARQIAVQQTKFKR
jgi:hypothetical protein